MENISSDHCISSRGDQWKAYVLSFVCCSWRSLLHNLDVLNIDYTYSLFNIDLLLLFRC